MHGCRVVRRVLFGRLVPHTPVEPPQAVGDTHTHNVFALLSFAEWVLHAYRRMASRQDSAVTSLPLQPSAGAGPHPLGPPVLSYSLHGPLARDYDLHGPLVWDRDPHGPPCGATRLATCLR